MSHALLRGLLGVAILGVLVLPVAADTVVASDNAGNYTSGWTNTSNAGSGFGAWALTTTGSNAGFFTGDSTQNGTAPSDGINSGNGSAWGLYANSGDHADAARGFGPLVANGSISFEIDNGYIDNGSQDGVSLLDGTNTLFSFYFTGGQSDYLISDGTGTDFATSLGYTDGGLALSFTQLTTTTYTLTISTPGGALLQTITGRSLANTGYADNFLAFNNNAGSGTQHNYFVNNMSVSAPSTSSVPLPASALGGSILLAGLAVIRRKK